MSDAAPLPSPALLTEPPPSTPYSRSRIDHHANLLTNAWAKLRICAESEAAGYVQTAQDALDAADLICAMAGRIEAALAADEYVTDSLGCTPRRHAAEFVADALRKGIPDAMLAEAA